MNISAVLFAGGESRRMGKDKATVLFRGKPLWQIQLDLLRALQPAEIFVSARTEPAWKPRDIRFVGDDPPSRGPLSGLAASLARIGTDHLLVLAIDMPFMTEAHLRLLRQGIKPGCGVIPMIGDRAEPLSAIYPAECRGDMEAATAGSDFSLQTLIKRLVRVGRLSVFRVGDQDAKLYRNLNEPTDFSNHAPF
jgi:molybdopterin-guanine dinucleotide biosynthesis protein A